MKKFFKNILDMYTLNLLSGATLCIFGRSCDDYHLTLVGCTLIISGAINQMPFNYLLIKHPVDFYRDL